MSKHINVNPDHYKVGGRERQGENVIHEVERREAKRVRRGERHRQPGVGISNRMPPEAEARDAKEHPPVEKRPSAAEEPNDYQTSRKAGARSMGQKEAGARYTDRPAPPSKEVEGAFGREGRDREGGGTE
jgi:hypothetical protein